ncbi:hypothetical protein MHK_000685, partial [Candidatus Magnetomorum sp. HK-1]
MGTEVGLNLIDIDYLVAQADKDEITSPKEGDQFLEGENIIFSTNTGICGILQDDYLVWKSNNETELIGKGTHCSSNKLSPGNHIITLEAVHP